MTGNGRHRNLTRTATLAICNLTLLALTAVPSAPQAVWGTSTAELPDDTPAVKYEHLENTCEPDEIGTATLCLYSRFGPGDPRVHPGSPGIKAGTTTEVGDITGVLPLCECGSPVEQATWSLVKSLYRWCSRAAWNNSLTNSDNMVYSG